MKNIAIAATVAGTLAFASAARADKVVDLGTLTGGSTTLESGILSTGGTTDRYDFSLSKPSTVYTSGSNQKLSGSFGPLTFTALDSPAVTVALKSGVSTIGSYVISSGQQSNFQFGNLLADTKYSLFVSGLGTGLGGGAYLLALTPLASAPVPGPAGLLVAGAGALMVASKRRRVKKAALA